MLLPTIRQFRKRRGSGREKQTTTPPPVALTLVSAIYDENVAELSLAFDRAVNIDGFQGAQVIVDDGVSNFTTYLGNSATLDSPTTVRVTLNPNGSSSASEVKLTASPLTGIVAVNDGGTWPGVTDVTLPYFPV